MPDSAIGFGPADFLEALVAGLLILFAFLWTGAVRKRFSLLAASTPGAMSILFVLPIVLRLLLLPNHPVPRPNIYDEFSHLLVADTLLHFRLANPPHPLSRYFETFFVLQQPSYSSIYPLGQGLVLAFGRLISGQAWTGVLLATGSFCACSYWALRGYVASSWALLGGLLAVMQFGPLNQWMNCYWGGAFPATAGCLVFGALPRLGHAWGEGSPGRRRDAVLLGVGLGLHLLTRPFETTLLTLCVLLFPWVVLRKGAPLVPMLRSGSVALLAIVPAVVLTAVQNKQVTGSWATLPEVLSQYEYGVPTTLTIQRPAFPHRQLTPEQALEYKSQALMHGAGTDTLGRYVQRLQYRVRDYRFFFAAPLYLAAGAFLLALRQRIYIWVALSLTVFAFGTNLFPYLLPHYLAGVAVLFLLVSIVGLQQIGRLRIRGVEVGNDIARVVVLLCGGQFLLWYSIHLLEGIHAPFALMQYETWDFINHGSGGRREIVSEELTRVPGKLLVLVHYSPRHIFQDEWVWNAADIDGSRIVFARDLGDAENSELIRYYSDRKVLRLEPDRQPPQLTAVR